MMRYAQVLMLPTGTVWKAVPHVPVGAICSHTWSQAEQLITAHILPPNTAKGLQEPLRAVPRTRVPVRSRLPFKACTW